ncbi:MAG: hypothetical protein IPH75_00525 [bacterium]|nr:hypothetical protein [bacterium]
MGSRLVTRSSSYAVFCFLSISLLVACFAAPSYALDRRFQLVIGTGLSDYQMDDINRYYLDAFAKPAGLFEGELIAGAHIRATIEYRLSHRFVVLGGFEYLSSSLADSSMLNKTSPNASVLGDYETESSFLVRGYLPSVGGRYILREKPLEIRCGMDIAYLFGEVDFVRRYYGGVLASERTSNGALFSPTVDLSYFPKANLAVRLSLGYRTQSVGSLKDRKGTSWSVESEGQQREIGLDFEGSFLTTSLVFEL